MKFKDVSNQPNFLNIEQDVLHFWESSHVFKKSLEQRKGQPEYVFYDGPPFATGLPHYGHLLAGTIKDVIPRYQTMRGKYVERTFGWDCHGLPVEYEMEKALQLSGKKQIETYGIDKFNEACRSIVLRYTAEWEKIVYRMGRWVDFEHGYRTMDRNYMESIWWVFKQLWDKGLIYEGHKILPYCARCSTPLSNFEANQGYADVDDPAITISFKSLTLPGVSYLAWTTTPWTLPSNMGLAVGADIDYVQVVDGEQQYILAEARMAAYYKDNPPQIIKRWKGAELFGHTYEPLFPYFADFAKEGAFKIVTAGYVSVEDGTGIVHIAPGFGEDDANVGKEHHLPEVCPIDEECRFTKDVSDYQGIYVKDADKDIIRVLKEKGNLVHRGTIKHSYPHCWRDDSPLIYKAVSTWFVRIDKIKEIMIQCNQQINWMPEHIKEGRFGKWLENARDWAISRNRFWGCPLPIWRNHETGEMLCIGSVAELEQYVGKVVPDIHKHFVDVLTIPSKKFPGTVLTRVPEVLDCWFESGSMPYAQQHYPFENKSRFEENFPAHFIAEGLDQTRGWFYTLTVLGAALFGKPAFKNVVVNGLILAENGQKMSKRKKNYPDPSFILDAYGADSLRLYLLGSPVVRGEDLKFSEKEGVREKLRTVLLPLWNAYSFFVTYANVDGWHPPYGVAMAPRNPSNALDQWILSSLAEMVDEIRLQMDQYQIQKAANRFEKFVDDLTNWYIRRSRRRFWKSQDDLDKKEAYQTLHFVLVTFCQAASPFIPFITEAIYRNLRTSEMAESVHLCDFPEAETWRRNLSLESQMNATMQTVKLGRFLRTQNELKTRQPLKKAVVVAHSAEIRQLLTQTSDIIAEELNVKKIEIKEDEQSLVSYSAKADFKVLGKRLGKEMKFVATQIEKLESSQIASMLDNQSISLMLSDHTPVLISASDITIKRLEKEGLCVATESGITIALDTEIDEALQKEGIAREVVSKIQTIRKESTFNVSDRINVIISTDSEILKQSIQEHSHYIQTETLTNALSFNSLDFGVSCDINGIACVICVCKNES